MRSVLYQFSISLFHTSNFTGYKRMKNNLQNHTNQPTKREKQKKHNENRRRLQLNKTCNFNYGLFRRKNLDVIRVSLLFLLILN